ncbi:MAG: DUF4013 domain-containing protein [Anaerolineae bacterium]|nr:DUF4013 domain-containing protein [Anaerolineae bacterium]
MNISRALQHPTQDPNFVKKLAITGLVALVPFLNFALFGYALDHSRNVMAGRDAILPDWDDIGSKFQRGLLLVLAQMVYLLPVFLIYGCFFVFIIAGTGLASAANTRQQERDVAAVLSVGSIAILCVVAIVALTLSLFMPGVYRQFYRHGTFASCLKFGEVLAFTRRRIVDIILAGLTLGAMGIGVGVVTIVLSFVPCLGTIAVMALSVGVTGYSQVVYAHLMGQIMLKDSQALAPVPMPLVPPATIGG